MTQGQIEVGIARIYVKDFSFESPKAPEVFQQQVQPELKIQVNINPKNLNNQFYEVGLNLLVEATQNQQSVFIVEIEQCGIFEIKNANPQQLDHILTVFAPTTLFPYARATIDHAMIQGSLPPLSLAPINFEGMRQQRVTNGDQDSAPHLPHA